MAALAKYEWAGEPQASESIKRVDGVEVERTVQIVGPITVDSSSWWPLEFPLPEGATDLYLRVEVRSTEPREGYDEAGYHLTFEGTSSTFGRARNFPADGQWHSVSPEPLALSSSATTGEIRFRTSEFSSPSYEARFLQVKFDDGPWPEYWDGDTPDETLNTLDPVDDWSLVDADYEHIDPDDDSTDDEVQDLEELDEPLEDDEVEPPEDLAELVPFWVSYELWGRNLDEATEWHRLAVEDFDGELEVEVDGLTAGANWEFRIRLIDRDGRHSKWSEPLQITLPTDFTPPPTPTAPFVDENLGFVTLSTDGTLTGPIPADMSHRVLYVQQMHPDGDPEGEPGDPRRVTTFTGAGSWSIGSLLVGVEYRAFLTAVDTTGNESAWSDFVTFTPTEVFDASELEAQLEHLNEERLPALEQSLSTGLQDTYDAAEARAQELADDALAAAAADAQAKYDAVSARQDASDDEIDAAKQAAADAHSAAGSAYDYAVTVNDRIDGQAQRISSTSAPSGTANEGTVWERFDSMSRDRKLIGSWEYRDGGWDSIEIAMEYLPMAEMGQAWVTDLQAERLFAETGEVKKLVVEGRSGNMILDPHFEDQDLLEARLSRAGVTYWSRFGEGSSGIGHFIGQGVNESHRPLDFYFSTGPNDRITATAGDSWSLKAKVGQSDGNARLAVEWFHTSGDRTVETISSWQRGATWENNISGEWTAPTGCRNFGLIVQFDDEVTSARIYAGFTEAIKVIEGHLVVRGLLQATTGELQELFFDEAVGNTIATGSGQFIEVDADQIRSTSWTGHTVTGPVVQSHEAEETGWKIRPGTGLEVWRSTDGHKTVQIDGDDNYLAGRLHAGMEEGEGITLDWGDKVRMVGTNEDGEPNVVRTIKTPYLNFRTDQVDYEDHQEPSLYLERGSESQDGMMIINPGYPLGTDPFRSKLNVVGDVRANRFEARDRITAATSIRVGPASNQPGGVYADGLRTRHQGRMPDDQGPHDTTIYGASGARQMEPGNAVRGRLTFDNPTPTGVRRCTVSAHVANTTWGYDNNRGATASSAAASASSMRYTLQPARNNSGTVEAWCYYAAYWV